MFSFYCFHSPSCVLSSLTFFKSLNRLFKSLNGLFKSLNGLFKSLKRLFKGIFRRYLSDFFYGKSKTGSNRVYRFQRFRALRY